MDSSYIDIKRQLEPYKETIFYYGLTERELVDIEQKLGKRFPNYFREFLKIFGVRQDFVFGLLKREDEFVERSSYLPDDIKRSFILIGDNGGEDFWLLNADNSNDRNLYEWQHWLDGEVVNLGYDFETLLKENISKLSDPAIERETNDKKYWCVQFAIFADNEQKIYSTVPLTLLQGWELKEISPAQVYCYETKAKLVDKVIKFTRQEHLNWNSPLYSFYLREPANLFGQKSLIKDIDNKFRMAFPEYGGMGDYGILPFSAYDE